MDRAFEWTEITDNVTSDYADSDLALDPSVVMLKIIPLFSLFPFEFGQVMDLVRCTIDRNKAFVALVTFKPVLPTNPAGVRDRK